MTDQKAHLEHSLKAINALKRFYCNAKALHTACWYGAWPEFTDKQVLRLRGLETTQP